MTEIAAGAAIPGIDGCGIGVLVCALSADITTAMASGTFVEDGPYAATWEKQVKGGWLAVTKHLHDSAEAYPDVRKGASSLEATLRELSGEASGRKKLVEKGYWRDDARMLYDGAAAIPGSPLSCGRP